MREKAFHEGWVPSALEVFHFLREHLGEFHGLSHFFLRSRLASIARIIHVIVVERPARVAGISLKLEEKGYLRACSASNRDTRALEARKGCSS